MANDIWGDDLDLFLKVQNLPDSAFSLVRNVAQRG